MQAIPLWQTEGVVIAAFNHKKRVIMNNTPFLSRYSITANAFFCTYLVSLSLALFVSSILMLVSSNIESTTHVAQAFDNVANSISALNQLFEYCFWLSCLSAFIAFLFPQRATKFVWRLKFKS